jgi:hypothetical protein
MGATAVAQEGIDCPRCGYDLRGMVERWREACPIDGRCGECGLHFAWGELFSQRAYMPDWCVEVAPPRWLPVAGAATLMMAFAPWKLWSSIRLTFPLKARRLAAYAVGLMAVCYVLFVAANGVAMHEYWRCCFRGAAPMTSTMSRGESVARMVLVPFSNEPLGQVVMAAQTSPFSSPRQLLGWWDGASSLLLYGVLVVVFGPCVLAAMVSTRWRAGVRVVHVVRIGAYSLSWAVALWGIGLAISLAYFHASWFTRPSWWTWADRAATVLVVAVPVFVFVWWEAAIRLYLRMQQSWMIAAVVTVVAGGGALAISLSLTPPFVMDIFERIGLVSP